MKMAPDAPDDLVAPNRIGRKPKHRARIVPLLRAAERVWRGAGLEPGLP